MHHTVSAQLPHAVIVKQLVDSPSLSPFNSSSCVCVRARATVTLSDRQDGAHDSTPDAFGKTMIPYVRASTSNAPATDKHVSLKVQRLQDEWRGKEACLSRGVRTRLRTTRRRHLFRRHRRQAQIVPHCEQLSIQHDAALQLSVRAGSESVL